MNDPLVSYIIWWIVGGAILSIWLVAVAKWSARREDQDRRPPFEGGGEK